MANKQIEQTEIDAPYELPEGWKWCRQNEVCRLTDGEKLTGIDYPYLEVKYLRGNKERETISAGKFIKKGTKVILVDGENSGEVFTIPEDGYMGSTFKALSIQNVNETYLQLFISTKKDLYRNNKKGSAIPHLNKDLFFNMPFPLPPTLEEQQRIVNRIETLFA
ncbi:MAG: restriction endonuclease subunit S, partial [Treponema sp.]|nr:restriction endonuclease subunit S [Treponema sp.]